MARARHPTPVQMARKHARCTNTKGMADGYMMSDATGASGSSTGDGRFGVMVYPHRVRNEPNKGYVASRKGRGFIRNKNQFGRGSLAPETPCPRGGRRPLSECRAGKASRQSRI